MPGPPPTVLAPKACVCWFDGHSLTWHFLVQRILVCTSFYNCRSNALPSETVHSLPNTPSRSSWSTPGTWGNIHSNHVPPITERRGHRGRHYRSRSFPSATTLRYKPCIRSIYVGYHWPASVIVFIVERAGIIGNNRAHPSGEVTHGTPITRSVFRKWNRAICAMLDIHSNSPCPIAKGRSRELRRSGQPQCRFSCRRR